MPNLLPGPGHLQKVRDMLELLFLRYDRSLRGLKVLLIRSKLLPDIRLRFVAQVSMMVSLDAALKPQRDQKPDGDGHKL
jgi:hypothetical protein